LRLAKTPPTVILLAGLQGSGKTTLAGKLGRWLKDQRHSPLLVACDLQRPNAVTQLQIVGGQASVEVFAPHPGVSTTGSSAQPGNGVGDPVDVARRGVEYARHKGHDVVVLDTAGRLGVDAEMMAQAAAIRDATNPDEILFVVDAMIGQDAVATALSFSDGVGFTGVVLTKLDGDARGGAALSVRHVTGRPILFASNGEKLTEFDVFHPDRMASRILGMGDMLTLIEQAEQVFEADDAERMASKIMGGDDFTLDDFLEQMMMIRKMGPIGNLLGMLPGMGQMKEAISQVDDRDLDRVAAIIRSMTPTERADPKLINGSRRLRIANGSGSTVMEVNQLVDRFFEARKMMKQMTGAMGMPGAGRRGKSSKGGKKGKKGKGGKGRGTGGRPNAAAVARALPPELRGLAGGGPAGAGAFPTGTGLPPGFQMPDLSKVQLPAADDER
jgi:signal recognition particle subunit SRP54